MKASMNRTGFSLSTYLSRVSGKSMVWSLWGPLTCSLIAIHFLGQVPVVHLL